VVFFTFGVWGFFWIGKGWKKRTFVVRFWVKEGRKEKKNREWWESVRRSDNYVLPEVLLWLNGILVFCCQPWILEGMGAVSDGQRVDWKRYRLRGGVSCLKKELSLIKKM